MPKYTTAEPLASTSSPDSSHWFFWEKRGRTWGKMFRDWKFWGSLLLAGGVIVASIFTQTWPLLVVAGVVIVLEQTGVFDMFSNWWKKRWNKADGGKERNTETLTDLSSLVVEETQETRETAQALETLYDEHMRLLIHPANTLTFTPAPRTLLEASAASEVAQEDYLTTIAHAICFASPEEWDNIMQTTLPFFIAHLNTTNIHHLDFTAMDFHQLPAEQQTTSISRWAVVMQHIIDNSLTITHITLNPEDQNLLATHQPPEWTTHFNRCKQIQAVQHIMPTLSGTSDVPAPLSQNRIQSFMQNIALPLIARIRQNLTQLHHQCMNFFAETTTAIPAKLIAKNNDSSDLMETGVSSLTEDPHQHKRRQTFLTQITEHRTHLKTFIQPYQRASTGSSEAAPLESPSPKSTVKKPSKKQIETAKTAEASRILRLYKSIKPLELVSALSLAQKTVIAEKIVNDTTFAKALSPEKLAEFEKKDYAGKLRFKKQYFHSQTIASDVFAALNALPKDAPGNWPEEELENELTDEELAKLPLPPGNYMSREEFDAKVAANRKKDAEQHAKLDELLQGARQQNERDRKEIEEGKKEIEEGKETTKLHQKTTEGHNQWLENYKKKDETSDQVFATLQEETRSILGYVPSHTYETIESGGPDLENSEAASPENDSVNASLVGNNPNLLLNASGKSGRTSPPKQRVSETSNCSNVLG